MTFKRYIAILLGTCFALLGLGAGTQILRDDFALFRRVSDRAIAIVPAYEKTSKYLLSLRYIPENFDGILVGSSLADQMMDTRRLLPHRIYNLSMDGADISELAPAIENCLARGRMQTLIICLDPALIRTWNSQLSSTQPNKPWLILGSTMILKYYLYRFFDSKSLRNVRLGDTWGYHDTHDDNAQNDTTRLINRRIQMLSQQGIGRFSVIPQAVARLDKTLQLTRSNQVRVILYYYPIPKRFFEQPAYQRDYQAFYRATQALIKPSDIVIDFNTSAYDTIRADDLCYSDQGHLSARGAKKVLSAIKKHLA